MVNAAADLDVTVGPGDPGQTKSLAGRLVPPHVRPAVGPYSVLNLEVSVRLQAQRCNPAAKVIGIMVAAALVGAACGRSAPEDASAEIDPAQEPASAGVQATSESSVVPPVATTTTTTAAPPASEPQPGGAYVVEPGDTLSVIAERFGLTTEQLSQANNITDVDSIRPGQELIIPPTG